jgi:hypothetical protein
MMLQSHGTVGQNDQKIKTLRGGWVDRLIMSTDAYETLKKQISAHTLDETYERSARMDLFQLYLHRNHIARPQYLDLAFKLRADMKGDCRGFMDEQDLKTVCDWATTSASADVHTDAAPQVNPALPVRSNPPPGQTGDDTTNVGNLARAASASARPSHQPPFEKAVHNAAPAAKYPTSEAKQIAQWEDELSPLAAMVGSKMSAQQFARMSELRGLVDKAKAEQKAGQKASRDSQQQRGGRGTMGSLNAYVILRRAGEDGFRKSRRQESESVLVQEPGGVATVRLLLLLFSWPRDRTSTALYILDEFPLQAVHDILAKFAESQQHEIAEPMLVRACACAHGCM